MKNNMRHHYLDGLRGLAAFVLVAFHANQPGLLHGYAGVDIFFVLSGYLITSLLLRDLFNDCFDFRHFYARRAVRLIPAACAILVLTAFVAAVIDHPLKLAKYSRSFYGAALYSANWIALNDETDYFQDDKHRPVLHYWSLSVEEQFYIVWPVFIWCIFSFKRKLLPIALFGVMILSFLSNIFVFKNEPMLSYFGSWYRTYQLVSGACLAYFLPLQTRNPPKYRSQFRRWFMDACITLVCILLFLNCSSINPASSYFIVGFQSTILSILCLLGLSVAQDCSMARVFSHPTLVYIGSRSYGLYLCHQPILFIVDIFDVLPGPGLQRSAILLLLSSIAAEILKRTIEIPFGSFDIKKKTQVLVASFLCILISLALIQVSFLSSTKFSSLRHAWNLPDIVDFNALEVENLTASTNNVSQPILSEESALLAVIERLQLPVQLQTLKKRVQTITVQTFKPPTQQPPTQQIPKVLRHEAYCPLRDFSSGVYNPADKKFHPRCNLPIDWSCAEGKSITVIGDSQGLWFYEQVKQAVYGASFPQSMINQTGSKQNVFKRARTKGKMGSRCNEAKDYFNLSPHPVLQPICRGCMGCESRSDMFTDGSRLEYLGIEKISDSQMPSNSSNFTQENVIDYLNRAPPDLILVNHGLHHFLDTDLAWYPTRFDWYMKALSEVGKNVPNHKTTVIWLMTSHCNDQCTHVMAHLNSMSKKILDTRGMPYLDAYNISFQRKDLMSDDVHFHGEGEIYYMTLADIAMSWYCKEQTLQL